MPRSASPDDRLARFAARAFLFAGLVLLLTGCDLWFGDRVPMLPQASAWQPLPLRALVSQSPVHVEAMELCTRARCGYDAVVARFSAEGQAAERLEATLADPSGLMTLLRKHVPGAKTPPLRVESTPVAAGGWTGRRVHMAGGTRQHQMYGLIAGRREGEKLSVAIAVSNSPGVTDTLARAMLR